MSKVLSTTEVKLVLFDLDGTLADTLPDLCAALNWALAAEQLPAIGADDLRPVVSSGSKPMVRQALKCAGRAQIGATTEERIVDTFLHRYESNGTALTHLFDGMAQTLAMIEQSAIRWGVVTNKLERFAKPIVRALDLDERVSCVVCGDSAVHAKPHPAPLLLACRLSEIPPHQCVYIGDAPGDILAAHRAGMSGLAARWGYLPPTPKPESWGADRILSQPTDLCQFLGIASFSVSNER